MRLLDRTPGGALATAYGRALIERGIGAFDELRLGMRDIEHLADPTIGEVRVGAPDAISAGLLCEVVDRFSLSNPRVTVNIVAANNMFPEYRLLRDRHVDFLLGGLTTPFVVEGLEAERLYTEQVFIVAGSKNKFTRRRKLGLADLIDEPWLLPRENIFSAHMVEAFRLSGLSLPAGGVKTYSAHQRMKLLATNRFFSSESGSVLRFNQRQFNLMALPISLPARSWTVGIITLKNRMVSPVALKFIECIRDVARPLA